MDSVSRAIAINLFILYQLAADIPEGLIEVDVINRSKDDNTQGKIVLDGGR